jgi:hypothetical protein
VPLLRAPCRSPSPSLSCLMPSKLRAARQRLWRQVRDAVWQALAPALRDDLPRCWVPVAELVPASQPVRAGLPGPALAKGLAWMGLKTSHGRGRGGGRERPVRDQPR